MADGIGAEWAAIGVNFVLTSASIWLNWRMVKEGKASADYVREQTQFLINDEIRKAYRELTQQEPDVGMDAILDAFERSDNRLAREKAGKIRELQRRSELYGREGDG